MMIFINEAYKVDTVYKPYAEGIIKYAFLYYTSYREKRNGQAVRVMRNPLPMHHGQHMTKASFLKLGKVMIVVQVNGKSQR